MLLRLILIGAAISLLAAFFGQRRLALWCLAALAVAAAALWGYESYQIRSQGELFAQGDIILSQVQIAPSGHRPNMFELSGHVRNNSQQTTLDGVLLALTLRDCLPSGECRELPAREQFVATKLAPQESNDFREKIYLDRQSLPQGELRVEYSVKARRGHRPVW